MKQQSTAQLYPDPLGYPGMRAGPGRSAMIPKQRVLSETLDKVGLLRTGASITVGTWRMLPASASTLAALATTVIDAPVLTRRDEPVRHKRITVVINLSAQSAFADSSSATSQFVALADQ